MFETEAETIGKILITLAMIYAAYYLGYQANQRRQSVNHRFFNPNNHARLNSRRNDVSMNGSWDTSDNFRDFIDECKDTIWDLKQNAKKTLRYAERTFLGEMEDGISDLGHEATKSLRKATRSLEASDARDFANQCKDKVSDLKHDVKKSLRQAKRTVRCSDIVDEASDLKHDIKKSCEKFARSLR